MNLLETTGTVSAYTHEHISQPPYSAVQPLDEQCDRLGLLVGGVNKELGLLSLFPFWCARCRVSRIAQYVKNFFCQGRDVNRQTLPVRRRKTYI